MVYFANLCTSRYPFLLVFLLVISAATETLAQPHAKQANGDIAPGVVVEKVGKDWSADKAGLQKGDLLLSWSQSGKQHPIESPVDVWRAEAFQRTGAEITFNGMRGQTVQQWLLVPDFWLLWTRPNFQGTILFSYLQGLRLADSGQAIAAIKVWRRMKFGDGNASARVWLLLQMAETASKARRWDEADAAFRKALQSIDQANAFVTAQVLEKWGYSFWLREEYSRASEILTQAFEETHRIPEDNILTTHVMSGLGLALIRAGHPNKAEPYLRSALERYKTLIPSSGELASYLVNLASVTWTRGDLGQAEKFYREAWQISGKTPPHSAMWAALEGMCGIAERKGNLESAESYCTQSLELLQHKASAGLLVADNLNWLADISLDRGDLRKALAFQTRGLTIRKKLAPNTLGLAGDLVELGLIAEEKGNLNEAIKLHLRALAIEHRIAPEGLDAANTLCNLCALARRRGDLSKADEYCRQALAIQKHTAPGGIHEAEMLRDLADVARDRGDVTSSQKYYLQVVKMLAPLAPLSTFYADSLAGLAKISLGEGRLDAAATYYSRALEALENRTAHLGGSNEIRASYRARNEGVYREYIDLLVAQKKPDAAFSVLERSRGRILLEMLAAAHVDVHRGADPTLLKRERGLRAEINAKSERRIHLLSGQHTAEQAEQIKAVEKEISDLTTQYQDIEAQLRSISPNYAALTQPQPLTAKEIQQQLLDRDTLLLEYSLGEKRSHVFAVTPDSLQVFALPGRARVESQARRVYKLLTARNHRVHGESFAQRQRRWRRADAAYQREARALSRMVLGPVAAQMKNKRLLIVADGALYYIPFAALPEPDPAKKSSLPLAVNHEIVSLPSASVLALLRQQNKDRKPAPQAVAVLADPVFDKNDPRVSSGVKASAQPASVRGAKSQGGEDDLFSRSLSAGLLTRSAADLGLRRNGHLTFSRLRYTRKEADAIRAVTPPSKVLEAVDFRASRATATSPELANYRIVHFATHGLLNSKHPELSGLVLSLVDKHGKPRDGFLTLQDIYNMNLSADLVVLSACETGLGKEISGEGLIGMTRGFMYAGASRVVASLWNVSDVATARLMAEFYRGMEEDKLSPAAALRAAQVKMWKQHRWRSPYYWAAFQIQGEWK